MSRFRNITSFAIFIKVNRRSTAVKRGIKTVILINKYLAVIIMTPLIRVLREGNLSANIIKVQIL